MEDDPRLELVHLLRRITVRLDLMGAEFAAAHRLHPTDLRALIHLLDARRAGLPATPGWLSAQLGLNSASVTALVDRLVRAGHVSRTRDSGDRRRVLLSVHEQAAALVSSFLGGVITTLADTTTAFDDDELATVHRFLTRVHAAVTDGPPQPRVRLVPLDESATERLLALAVRETEPTEVLPPLPGPPGWTRTTRTAFRDFYDRDFGKSQGTLRYGIECAGTLTGMIRLTLLSSGTAETGMWLGRSARGRGIGTAAVRALLTEAAATGVHTIIADTTAGNTAAVGALRNCGATFTQAGDKVYAELRLP
ncbi:GNAT family N-acetyltransferase [Actinokineospora sp.]|uniref:GNAT family N-acetyltransferase n=1 Tax=Actinokineospora sp. TaxID=1872133 RepID=UPI004037D40A